MPADAAPLHSTAPTARYLPHLSARELITEIAGSDLAPNVLAADWPDLMGIVHMDEHALSNVLGIPIDAARRLAAALEMYRRLVKWKIPERPPIHSTEEAVAVLAALGEFDAEHAWVLPLDSAGCLIGRPLEISKGDTNGTDMAPRMTFRAAVRVGASVIIIAHNHPSGDPEPSREDLRVTKALVRAGRTMDCAVADHIIVTADRSRWHSMRVNNPEVFG